MAVLNSFLNALATGDNVRDFRHASRTFVDGQYRLAPKHRFLFHVVFGVNPGLGFTFPGTQNSEASFLVKNVELPRYSYDLQQHNQYNRKRYTYNKINYEPVRFTFHDDNSDTIRNMWYAHYAFYNQDPNYESSGTYSSGGAYENLPISEQNWGLDRNSGNFFSHIKIYSLYQKKYTEYWLVNPIIESFEHDRHDYADATGTLEHQMTVRFETVKYRAGMVNADSPAGFGTQHYDTASSPLTPQGGGTTSVFGPGGLVDAAGSIGADLSSGNLGGAVVTGLRAAKNLKGANLKGMLKSEITGMAMNALRGQNPVGDFSFPSSKSPSTGGNPLPQVPRVSGISSQGMLPPGANNVSSNGSLIAGNFKSPLGGVSVSDAFASLKAGATATSGKGGLPLSFNTQSMISGMDNAFDMGKGIPSIANNVFGSMSPFTDPKVTSKFQSDLATAKSEAPAAIKKGMQEFKQGWSNVMSGNWTASPKANPKPKPPKLPPGVIST